MRSLAILSFKDLVSRKHSDRSACWYVSDRTPIENPCQGDHVYLSSRHRLHHQRTQRQPKNVPPTTIIVACSYLGSLALHQPFHFFTAIVRHLPRLVYTHYVWNTCQPAPPQHPRTLVLPSLHGMFLQTCSNVKQFKSRGDNKCSRSCLILRKHIHPIMVQQFRSQGGLAP